MPQIEAYATKYGIKLKTNAWKVELAKLVKERFLQNAEALDSETILVQRWQELFERLALFP